MTLTELRQAIDDYRTGLEAEIAVLLRLEEIASRQRDAAAAQDLPGVARAADERDRLMAALVSIEQQLRGTRQILSDSRPGVTSVPGYPEAVELHRQAIELISRILRTDAASFEALASAELVRRDIVRAMEQGETTLAAYRRVMATPPGAALVDRRG